MVKYYFQQRINSQRIETKRNSNIQIKLNIYQVDFFPFLLYIINYNIDKKDIPFFSSVIKHAFFHSCLTTSLCFMTLSYSLHTIYIIIKHISITHKYTIHWRMSSSKPAKTWNSKSVTTSYIQIQIHICHTITHFSHL